jgi:Tol biopolymer transport system component/Tfp pilus assembly protein PilF
MILTTSGQGWLTLWDQDGTLSTTQQPQYTAQYGAITAVAFSRNGKMVATAGSDRTVMLRTIDGATFPEKEFLEGQEGKTNQQAVLDLSFSPNGKWIAGGVGNKVQVWSTDDPRRKPRDLLTTKDLVLGVDFSPDGRNIVVADRSGAVVVVNSESGAPVPTWHESGRGNSPAYYGIRYNPDGRTIAAAIADTVRIWTADGTSVKTLSGHKGGVVGFAFSPDGKWVASASKDGTVEIWEQDGTLVNTLSGHEGVGDDIVVSRVSFSPDGKWVASASEGRKVILWKWQEDLGLGGTLADACQWIRDYLTNNSKVVEDDRHLCDGIARLQESPPAARAVSSVQPETAKAPPAELTPLPFDDKLAVRLAPPEVVSLPPRSASHVVGNRPAPGGETIDTTEAMQPKLDQQVLQLKNLERELQAAHAATIRELDREIERKPSNAAAYYRRGQRYAQIGDFTRAIADFGEAIRLNPKDHEAFNNRCWARANVGDLQLALRDCNAALRLAPRYRDALNSRGFVNLKSDLPSDAIADYDAALRFNPNHPSSLYGRGIAKLRSGNAVGGNEDIAAAKAIQSVIAEEFASYGIR